MSAEVLRRAAALMRSRAREATPSPWVWEQIEGRYSSREGLVRTQHPHYEDQANEVAETLDGHDAVFIAGMSPAVALAVADWLDEMAQDYEPEWSRLVRSFGEHHAYDFLPTRYDDAFKVARAYLGDADV